ncbi:MAG: diguanylate cyclase [bacterium]
MTQYKKTKTDEVPIVSLPDDESHPRQAYLFVLAGSAVGQMVRVDRELSLGCTAEADVRLTGDGIAEQHCRLVGDPAGGVRLECAPDGGETFVNNEPVRGTVELSGGDRIRLGPATLLQLTFQDPVEAEARLKLSEASLQDGLTRLHNADYLEHRLHAECAFALRHETMLSLSLLDLDGFTRLNDEHGHRIGDQILQTLASLMSDSARPEDVCVRLSGGTFAVISIGMGIDDAVAQAEQLRQRIARHTFIGADFSFSVTVSFGLAALPHPAIKSADDLLTGAKRALAEAKQAGRDQHKIFTE